MSRAPLIGAIGNRSRKEQFTANQGKVRGIAEVHVLLISHYTEFEDEFINILLALNISDWVFGLRSVCDKDEQRCRAFELMVESGLCEVATNIRTAGQTQKTIEDRK